MEKREKVVFLGGAITSRDLLTKILFYGHIYLLI